jgi:preprotein translocase SecE subunit
MALLVEKKTGIIDTLGLNNEVKPSKVKPKEKIKRSFISNYLNELKDVDWPTKKQSVVWFFTTIAVCSFLGTVILSSDRVYKSMFKLVECSSPKGSNVGIGQCLKELPKNILSDTL